MNYSSADDDAKFTIDTGEKLAVLGKSNSGKSTFLRNLIECRDFTFREPVTRIIYVYKFAHEWFNELSDVVEFKQDNIPDDIAPNGHNLLIIDDACEGSFEEISNWFLRSARHTRTTIVFVYQTIFNAASEAYKRIVNNTDVFVFTYQPKGRYQLSILFRQFFATKEEVKNALRIYNDAMQVKYSYLVFDTRQAAKYRFRTNIFYENGCLETAHET
jgi:ABC-type dipeptide/oligopeptide/nickel transport system ATPase component